MITSNSAIYITKRYFETIPRSHIHSGCLLFSIMGSIGNQAIVPINFGPATANRAVGILSPKKEDPTLTRFLFYLFQTDLGSQLFERLKKGGLQKRINLVDVKTLKFPLLPEPYRSKIVFDLDTASEVHRKKLQEAEDLFRNLDNFVLDALGLSLQKTNNYLTTYAVHASEVRAFQKIYPDYFHPERLKVICSIQSRYSGDRARKLSDIADFICDQKAVDPEDDYLGLANVQPNTGERVIGTEEDGKGACFTYAKGDVLFARLRPYLNKVYLAESGGVCSTEFHVLRIQSDRNGRPKIDPDYLAAVMRSRLVLAQTRHMMTGNTHPRLSNDDVVNLVIPVPDPTVQENIAAEVDLRRKVARMLRDEATQMWEETKRQFEKKLLGVEPSDLDEDLKR